MDLDSLLGLCDLATVLHLSDGLEAADFHLVLELRTPRGTFLDPLWGEADLAAVHFGGARLVPGAADSGGVL